MQIKDQTAWQNYLDKNKDSYGKGILDYAARWATLMEEKMAAGSKLEDVAESTSHEADTDGITGFMYGAAVATLSIVWLYGEQLRKWHNHEYNHDGEGVVNPALLTIKTS